MDYDAHDAYDKIKEDARARVLATSQAGRDIANDFPPTDTIDWDRRNEAWDNLEFFLHTYFPSAFYLPWSKDHLRVIEKLQAATVDGGLFALAMPRSSGKSTLIERAALWAILTGRRRYVCLIGATQDAAERLLAHIKAELQYNPLLLEDFPTACYPIVRLENNAKRCVGQHYNGSQTLITWTSAKLVFPTIARTDSTCSGSVITACGLTGNLRGQAHILTTGEPIRPSFIMLDDPQTRESAASASQTQTRLEILLGDVLGLGGVGENVTAVCAATVIYKGDFADQLLDRSKFAQFRGERTKLLYSFPSNEKLWDEYRGIRDEAFRNDKSVELATEFYRKHQDAMDVGSNPAWKERFNPDEISATQHCMNLFFRDSASFNAEYQNDPTFSSGDEQETPKATDIITRINNYKQGLIPSDCQYVTAFIDVQHSLLYWCVVAYQKDFTGYVINYGTYPDQKRPYFTLQQARYTLQTLLPGAALAAQVYNGLDKLVNQLCEGTWVEDGGTPRHIDRILIDASDGAVRNNVYKFCRESKYSRVVAPAHGQFIGATKKPYSEYTKHRGDIYGNHWRSPAPQKRGEVRHILTDVNWYKSFLLFQLLTLPKGSPGAMTLYGDNPSIHRMFADQLVAETCVRVSTAERTTDEWKILPNRPDNHFFDCLIGCCVGASMCGANILAKKAPIPKNKPEPKPQQFTRPRINVSW